MADYCTEDDLKKIRPNIMEFGVKDWSDQINEAGDIIDRVLETRWYRRLAEENGLDWRVISFDRLLLLNASTELVRLGCYKTLELCYLFLMKHSQEADAFERQRGLFSKLYSGELKDVLDAGFDYDWDQSGAIDPGESKIPQVRRLVRV